jgi:hypothetical protein
LCIVRPQLIYPDKLWDAGGVLCSWSHWNARCFQAEVIINGPKETGDLLRQEACSFDVVSR